MVTSKSTISFAKIASEADAYDLIMCKDFAWEIIEGRKRLEFRNTTFFYVRKFLVSHGTPQESFDAFGPRGYGYIHFLDYGNTWFLDVASELMHIISFHPCNLYFLHKFCHYEFDEIAEENRDKTDPSDVPCLFALEIDSVLNTSLCPLTKIEKEGKVKVCRTIR